MLNLTQWSLFIGQKAVMHYFHEQNAFAVRQHLKPVAKVIPSTAHAVEQVGT